MLGTILLVFAFVLAVCAAFNVPAGGRVSLGWAAFACYVASQLFGAILH